jgi:hypothetical protein
MDGSDREPTHAVALTQTYGLLLERSGIENMTFRRVGSLEFDNPSPFPKLSPLSKDEAGNELPNIENLSLTSGSTESEPKSNLTTPAGLEIVVII